MTQIVIGRFMSRKALGQCCRSDLAWQRIVLSDGLALLLSITMNLARDVDSFNLWHRLVIYLDRTVLRPILLRSRPQIWLFKQLLLDYIVRFRDHRKVVKQCLLAFDLIVRHRCSLSLPLVLLSPHIRYDLLAYSHDSEPLLLLHEYGLARLYRLDSRHIVLIRVPSGHHTFSAVFLTRERARLCADRDRVS